MNLCIAFNKIVPTLLKIGVSHGLVIKYFRNSPVIHMEYEEVL